MVNEIGRFGEKMQLIERAKEDIYFAEKDAELIAKIKASLKKVETAGAALHCPKCNGELVSYDFMSVVLERCSRCDGVWLDNGELETILKKLTRSPLAVLAERFFSSKGEEAR
jgi:Zn-finger nucleic acid-binding protein